MTKVSIDTRRASLYAGMTVSIRQDKPTPMQKITRWLRGKDTHQQDKRILHSNHLTSTITTDKPKWYERWL